MRGWGASPRSRKKWRIEQWRGLWRPIVLNCSVWQCLLHSSRKLVLHSSDSLKFSFSGPLIATNQKLGYPNPVCKCVLFDLHSVFKTKQVESLSDSKCADSIRKQLLLKSHSWRSLGALAPRQDSTFPTALRRLGPSQPTLLLGEIWNFDPWVRLSLCDS